MVRSRRYQLVSLADWRWCRADDRYSLLRRQDLTVFGFLCFQPSLCCSCLEESLLLHRFRLEKQTASRLFETQGPFDLVFRLDSAVIVVVRGWYRCSCRWYRSRRSFYELVVVIPSHSQR